MSPEVPTLRGERVTLRPMVVADTALLSRWFSDEEFQRHQWGAWHGPMSLGEARNGLRRRRTWSDSSRSDILLPIDQLHRSRALSSVTKESRR